MIDCHCHLLPGFDDGPKTLDESVEIARILADGGFTEVYCTPHMIKGAFDNGDVERLNKAVLALQTEIDKRSIPLRLHPGLEYYMDEFLASLLDNPLTFAGSGLLMIEAPRRATPSLVKESIYQVVRRGYIPLLAHVERYDFVGTLHDHGPAKTGGGKNLLNGLQFRFVSGRRTVSQEYLSTGGETERLYVEELRAMGCLFEGNLGSFAGIHGERTRKRAIRYLERGLYSRIGSDAHRPERLQGWLQRGLTAVRNIAGEEGLRKLTDNRMECSIPEEKSLAATEGQD
jgi:protein-tyrosine phosphatase